MGKYKYNNKMYANTNSFPSPHPKLQKYVCAIRTLTDMI